MDTAATAANRLRELLDLLDALPGITDRQRHLHKEAKAIVSGMIGSRPAATIEIRHSTSTMPEPSFVTLRMPEGGR